MDTFFNDNSLQKFRDSSEPILKENAGFISDELVKIIDQGILENINNPQFLDLTRIYLDGGYRKDLTANLYQEVDSLNASIRLWDNTISCLNDEEFFIAIGRFEMFCEELTSHIAKYLSPIIDHIVEPYELSLSLFAGNYNYTPFGIHVDEKGLSAIHLHLGPNPKKMYLWTPEVIESEIENPQQIRLADPQSIVNLKLDTNYLISEGDLFFLPTDKFYHIGSHTNSYSVAISVGIHKYDLKSSLTQLATESLFRKIDQINPNTSSIKDISHILSSDIVIEKDALINDLEILEFTKKSNLGFATALSAGNSDEFLQSSYCLKKPFQILYSSDRINKSLHIYSRGCSIEVDYHSELISLIKKINSSQTFLIKEFVNEFSHEFEASELQAFFSFLIETNLLQKVNGRSNSYSKEILL